MGRTNCHNRLVRVKLRSHTLHRRILEHNKQSSSNPIPHVRSLLVIQTHLLFHQKSDKFHNYFKVPYTILFCYIGLILVGIGSWMFHMTLLYPMQLLDELPMVFGSGILVYANYDILLATMSLNNDKRGSFPKKTIIQSLLSNQLLIFCLLLSYCVIFSYIYLYVWTDPIFHEIAYSVLTLMIIGQNIVLIKILGLSKRLYVLSFIYFMFGFLLWNIDNKFCHYLGMIREGLEGFIGISKESAHSGDLKAVLLNILVVSLKSLTEFHSLWHMFTGYGSFMVILFLTEVHYQYYLVSNRLIDVADKVERPVSSKFFNMYYHLNNDLISEKSANNRKKV